MKIGIFGLPQSGKTTVFRVLVGRADLMARDPHGEMQTAVVKLPDERLDFLVEVYQPQKVSPAEVTFVDTVALRRGRADARQAENLTALLGDAEAFALVIRCFDLSGEGDASTVAQQDLESLLLELALTDLPVFEKRLERLEKELRSGRRDVAAERGLLVRCREHLEHGGLLKDLTLSAGEDKALRGYRLLTMKPMLVVANLGESMTGGDPLAEGGALAGFQAHCDSRGLTVIAFCAALEAEIEELAPDEQAAFLADYGIERPARDSFLRASFDLLGLVTFFTGGPTEVHAWPIPAGTTAIDAAGKIHTDLARGFIRADTIAYADMVAAGSEAECRKRGTSRLEGKDYRVRDGDILLIRFSV